MTPNKEVIGSSKSLANLIILTVLHPEDSNVKRDSGC
jgi:hypothetical protein